MRTLALVSPVALLVACSLPSPDPREPDGAGPVVDPDSLPSEPSWHDPASAAPTIVVDEGALLQTLDGIGANAYPFPIQGAKGWDWEAVAPELEALGLDYVRIVSWGRSRTSPTSRPWSATTRPRTCATRPARCSPTSTTRGSAT